MNPSTPSTTDTLFTSGEIRYSQVWEDAGILSRGLEIQPSDHVLSIASAGCNALALLLEEPQSVTMVDLNPAQTALCHLKLAAIKELDYADFIGFWGAREHSKRWELFLGLRNRLPEGVAGFWAENRALIERGLLFSGRLERFFRNYQVEHLSQFHNAATLRNFLESDTLETQKRFFEEVMATPPFVADFKDYFGKDNFAQNGRSREQFQYAEYKDVGNYLFDRFRYACVTLPIQSNFYMEAFLTSHFRNLEIGPHYLRPDAFTKLKSLVDRVKIVTAKIDDHLLSTEARNYSKVNLSDLFEYLSVTQTQELMEVLASRVADRGRIAYWNFLTARTPGEELRGRLEVQGEFSHRLWLEDNSWAYCDFQVATLTI